MIEGKRILVTGGAGFIGSNLVSRLNQQNNVRILDDFSTGSADRVGFLSDSQVRKGDIRNPEIVAQELRDRDIVVHLAAIMGVQRTLENPLSVLEVNLCGLRTVLKQAVKHDVNRVVSASTSEVYGSLPPSPYQEDGPTAPETDYAVAKLAAERYVRAYTDTYGIDHTILRYFNVYGPSQDGSQKGYVVPQFVRGALAGKALEVHGKGDQTRDFTFISDAVDATLSAMGPAGRNTTFNVGTGVETSIRDLADIVVETVGQGSIQHVEHPRPYVIKRRCASIERACDTLDYEPCTSLREGVAQMTSALQSTHD